MNIKEAFCKRLFDVTVKANGQVLPMVKNFVFGRPELLPGFLIKLNIKN